MASNNPIENMDLKIMDPGVVGDWTSFIVPEAKRRMQKAICPAMDCWIVEDGRGIHLQGASEKVGVEWSVIILDFWQPNQGFSGNELINAAVRKVRDYIEERANGDNARGKSKGKDTPTV